MKTSAVLRHACEYFSQTAPADAPPLPRSYEEREKLKVGGVPHIVAWFARSLEVCNYDFGIHPLFSPYARGVLASSHAPEFITQDLTLQQRFPPLPLKGLGRGLYWSPLMAPVRSAKRSQRRLFLSNPPPPQCQHSHGLIRRQDANVPPWYAPSSNAFLQLDDEFVAHATRVAPGKRLPYSWGADKPYEVFSRIIGGYELTVVNSDYGWIIERRELFGPEMVLVDVLAELPVLCATYVTAARLAEAAHVGLPTPYLLMWMPSN